MSRAPLNIAHRGASGDYVENTLGAFRAAIAEGAQMCELDVQRTRDGALVVMHDETVDRTTDGSGRVVRMALAEIKALDGGAWRDARFAGERIPTLEEVLAAVTGNCALNIELKAEGIEKQVCATVRRFEAESWSIVSSFDWEALARVRRIAPEIRIGLLASNRAARLLDAAVEMKAAAVHPRHDLVGAEFCVEAHRQGLAVYAWTVDEPLVMRRLIALGVDGIMTNYPARLRAVINNGAVQSG